MQGISKARRKAGYPVQKRFAEHIGMDPKLYNKIETGQVNPTPETFKTICKVTGLPPKAIATPNEVDYGIRVGKGKPKTQTAPKRQRNPRISLSLPMADKIQTIYDLETCGYASQQDWLDECRLRLHARAEEKRRERE